MAGFDFGSAVAGAMQGFAMGGGPFTIIAGFIVGGFAGGDAKRSARNKARSAYNAAQQNRSVMVRSGREPRRIVMGRCRVSGPLVYAQSTGDKLQFLHLVVVLAAHRIHAIDEIWLNDIRLPALDVDGFVGSGEFSLTRRQIASHEITTGPGTYTLPHAPVAIIATDKVLPADGGWVTLTPATYVGTSVTVTDASWASGETIVISYEWDQLLRVTRVSTGLGTDDQAAIPDLVTESGGLWTAAHRLRGLPYVYVRCEYENDVYGAIGGVPNVSCVVRGAMPRDPRTGVAAYTENPAALTAWLLREWLGATEDEVPDGEWGDLADVCDQVVSITDFGRAALVSNWDAAGVLDGWSSTGATLFVADGLLTISSTGSDPTLWRAGLSIVGTTHRTVRARVRRLAGSGWQGRCYYSTGAHAPGVGYYKAVAAPAWDVDGWAVVEWDMAALTAGGTDWISSTITGVEMHLGSTASDVFELDWLAIGAESTEPRFALAGVIGTDTARRDALDQCVATMAGRWVYSQGRFRVTPGVWVAPTKTITADMLADDEIRIAPKPPKADRVNAIVPTYAEPAQDHKMIEGPVVTRTTYQTADGGELREDMQQPLTSGLARSQRLARIDLERSRAGMTVELTTNLRAYDITPGEIVALTLDRYGWAAKPFEALTRSHDVAASRIAYTLQETGAAVFDTSLTDQGVVDLTPNTSLASPVSQVASLSGLAVVSSGEHERQPDGTVLTMAAVSWTAVADQFVAGGGSVEIQWRRADSAEWIAAGRPVGTATSARIGPLQDGARIVVRARAVNVLGRAGAWMAVGHAVVGAQALLSTPQLAENAATEVYRFFTAGPVITNPAA